MGKLSIPLCFSNACSTGAANAENAGASGACSASSPNAEGAASSNAENAPAYPNACSAAPDYSRPGDGAVDLRSAIDADIRPFERRLIPCGFSLAIPEGYVGLVLPRSGLALNHGITVLNAPGLIDANYRGEIGVILVNLDSRETFTIVKGDRIAQLLVIPADTVTFTVSESLPSTERGSGGFGSSGR